MVDFPIMVKSKLFILAKSYRNRVVLYMANFVLGRRFNRSLDRKRKCSPVDKKRSQKFSGANSFFGPQFSNSITPFMSSVPDSLINRSVCTNLSSVLNMGLSDASWGKYKTSLII